MAWSGFLVVGLFILFVLSIIYLVNKKQAIVGKIFIVLFIFFVLSISYVFIVKKVPISSASGVLQGLNLYFSWIGNILNNLFSITGYAISQDWKVPDKEDFEKLNETNISFQDYLKIEQ